MKEYVIVSYDIVCDIYDVETLKSHKFRDGTNMYEYLMNSSKSRKPTRPERTLLKDEDLYTRDEIIEEYKNHVDWWGCVVVDVTEFKLRTQYDPVESLYHITKQGILLAEHYLDSDLSLLEDNKYGIELEGKVTFMYL